MAISTINQNGLNAPLSLTAPNLGTPSAINLTNATALPSAALPTGSILQVVNATTTSNFTTTSGSYVSTGFSASITPKFSTSKIVVMVTGNLYSNTSGGQCYATIYRGGTNIGGNGVGIQYASGATTQGSFSPSLLDSPATTSSTSYTVYLAVYGGGTAYFNVANPLGASTASIILMEIAG